MNNTEDAETHSNNYKKLIDINEKKEKSVFETGGKRSPSKGMGNLQPLQGIYLLLEKVYPKSLPHNLVGIVDINQNKMTENLQKIPQDQFEKLTGIEALEKLNEDDKKWQKPNSQNLKRKAYLSKLLKYLEREHLEMVNLDRVRAMVPIKKVKLALSRSSFINFSIKDNFKNMHLEIQGTLLQIFLYYHMKHDMRFKGKINSLEIEMDNPFARHQIREENRKDDFLGKKYLVDMEVDEWCKHLLENFFPNMSGIWADHTHVTHVYILEIIRFSFECGFIDLEDCETLIPLLYRAVQSLLKLEEAWMEKLDKISKISDTLKASNVTDHFAKCRENVACILVQILTLYQDDYFIKNFSNLEGVNPEEKAGQKKIKEELKKMKATNYPLLNSAQNEMILFITMNYLSNTVQIGNQTSRNETTLEAVEKIFLYITTDDHDCFLESIKQITTEDLKYFDKVDVISDDIRDKCDNLGYTFKTLLKAIGMGYFDKATMALNKDLAQDKEYGEFLGEYISQSKKKKLDVGKTASNFFAGQTNKTHLFLIVECILDSFRADLEEEDFRVATVKESIPLMLIALGDYATEYFSLNKFRKRMMKDIFDVLYKITSGNNFCKGQIFKGDSLFHLRKLAERQNKYVFFFLNKLCDSDENIAIFFGRGFFDEIIEVFKDFQQRVLEDFQIATNELSKAQGSALGNKLSKDIDVDDWAMYIILNNLFSKLMTKKFINETDKLQSSLKIQEAIVSKLSQTLIKEFIKGLKDKSGMEQRQDLLLTKDLFLEGNENQLISLLDQREEDETLTYYDLKVIIMQLCYSSIRAFNMACSSVYSDNVKVSIEEELETLRGHLLTSSVHSITIIDPFGIDTEIVKLLRNFSLVPEANILIEREYELRSEDNEVFDHGDPAPSNIEFFLKRAAQYAEEDTLRDEGEKFLMEGVLPYIYKYATTLLNLTKYEVKSTFVNPYDETGMSSNKKSANNLTDNLEIAKTVFRSYIKFNPTIRKLIKGSHVDTLNTNEDVLLDMENLDKATLGKKNLKDKKIDRLTDQMILICNKIMRDIEKVYTNSKYSNEINQFKQMSQKEFEQESKRARFQSEAKTEDIKIKKMALNGFIQIIREAKEEYLTGEDGPNLISYFDQNTDNLNGVFNSCIEKIFFIGKKERDLLQTNRRKIALMREGNEVVDLEIPLTKDVSINRFWMNQSCYAYIEMLEKLISSSKTAREEFYSFITEGEDDNDESIDGAEELEINSVELNNGVGNTEADYKNLEVGTNPDDRQKLIGMLSRIQHDLLLFLNTSPTQKPIWWNVYEIYEMLCSFFKNLCENNFKEFKEYLGEKVPKTNDVKWNIRGHTCTQIFTDQLTYLLDCSKLATNRESAMVHTDQRARLQPLLLPLINTLNELVTGPCELNQKILVSKPIDKIFQILTRIINNIEDSFMDLKHSCLILVISLTEGFNKKIIEQIALRATPSIILNQIQRLTKKIYVSQLIEGNSYQKELRIAQIEKKREIEARKKKKKKGGVAPSVDKNQSKLPTQAKLPDMKESNDTGSILLSNHGSPLGSRIQSASSSNKIIPVDRDAHAKAVATDRKRKMLVQSSTLKRAGIDVTDVLNPNTISQDLESSISIKHWDKLFEYYLSLPDFSEGPLFDFIFRIVILWQSLCKFSKRHKASLMEIRQEAKSCFNRFSTKKFSAYQREISSIFFFFDKIMLNVEIKDPNGTPLLVFFPRRPECFLLSEEDKKNYREECNISDSNTKMLDLMRNFDLFKIQMDGNIKNYRTQKLMYSIGSKDAFAIYTVIAWILGVLINIFMYIWLYKVDGGILGFDTTSHKDITFYICYLHIAFSAVCLILWFSFRYKQRAMIMREDFIFDNPLKDPNKLWNKININVYKAIISSPIALNMTLHILFTALGMYYSFFVLSFNLLLIINISRTTKYVIQSITLHFDQLILTLIMTMFVIFSFTILIAEYYTETLDNAENLCTHLDTCYIFTVNWGLRNGGGIADSMIVQPKGTKYLGKSIHDVLFFMIVNVIALNIIFGIIIDTFSQLRDEQQERGKHSSINTNLRE